MRDKSSPEQLFSRLMNTKLLLSVANVLVFLIALATFGLCMWIRFDLDFRVWIRTMDWYSYWYCMYVILFGVCFALLGSVLSIWGTYSNSFGLLNTTHFLNGTAIFLEFVGCIVLCVFGVEESDTLIWELRDKFMAMVNVYQYDDATTRIFQQIMEYVGCCGSNGAEDFDLVMKPLPYECRDLVTGREYSYGCAQQLAWWLEPWTAALAGISIGLILFHIAQIVITSKMKKRMRQYGEVAQEEFY